MKIFLLLLHVGHSKTVKFSFIEETGTNSDSADIISGSGSTEVNSINTVDQEPNINPPHPANIQIQYSPLRKHTPKILPSLCSSVK